MSSETAKCHSCYDWRSRSQAMLIEDHYEILDNYDTCCHLVQLHKQIKNSSINILAYIFFDYHQRLYAGPEARPAKELHFDRKWVLSCHTIYLYAMLVFFVFDLVHSFSACLRPHLRGNTLPDFGVSNWHESFIYSFVVKP